jgi:hypothetical protein
MTTQTTGQRSTITSTIRRIGRTGARGLAMLTAAARQAPDLVVIGAKRAGTTSLFRDLEAHESMCPLVPSARRLPMRENIKGVHYFDTNADRPWRWYVSHFVTKRTKRRVATATGAAFTVEASPYYLFHPLAAGRAASILPTNTLFIAVLRDPVERTVSHWSEQTRNGVEVLPLHEAITAEKQRIGADDARLASGEISSSHAHEHQSYCAQSRYAVSLQRWFDAVGRDRVIVLFAENYATNSASVVDTITERIGAPPSTTRSGQHRNAAPRSRQIDDQLDRRLTDWFRDDVAALTGLLGVAPPWPRFNSASFEPDLPKSLQ